MTPCTLIHTSPCGLQRRRDVDLPTIPSVGAEIGGCLSGLHVRCLRVRLFRLPDRTLVWVDVPGRDSSPHPVPAWLWERAGWRERPHCDC